MASKIIIDLLLPRRAGGVTKWGEDLVRALEKEDFQFRIFRGEKEILKYLIFSKKGDLVHTTIPLPWKPRGKPLILTIHGLYTRENNIWSKVYPRTIRIADKITTPTKWLKEKLNLSQIQVIPNGIFLDQKKIKRKFDFENKNEINILTITNFNFYEKCRGIKFIYKALKELDLSDKKIILHILGDGEFKKDLQQEIKSQNNLKIVFEGFQKPADFFKQADIFVHYSFLDILPLVILEAMNYGLPIVSNNFGAVREIIYDKIDGRIISDAKQMKEAIKSYLYNPKQTAVMAEAGFNKMKTEFDWEKISKKWNELYSSLV